MEELEKSLMRGWSGARWDGWDGGNPEDAAVRARLHLDVPDGVRAPERPHPGGHPGEAEDGDDEERHRRPHHLVPDSLHQHPSAPSAPSLRYPSSPPLLCKVRPRQEARRRRGIREMRAFSPCVRPRMCACVMENCLAHGAWRVQGTRRLTTCQCAFRRKLSLSVKSQDWRVKNAMTSPVPKRQT